LRQIKLTKPDLVLIEAHKHNVFARFLLTQTDFELIRHCPVPLLIVKGHAAWRSPSILAALDPFHSKDKPSKLDEVIIGAARAFAEKTSGTLHAAHIFKPLLPYLPSVPGTTLIEVSGADKRTYEAAVRKHFYEAVARHGLPKSKAHLIGGDSMLALPELAHTLRAGLVVMGAVSRSALKRLFIGSTAEHVLDRLECDVLIVKLKR
jgi:universal stress protein E